MKKFKILSLALLAVVAVLVLYVYRTTTADARIHGYFNDASDYEVSQMEEMRRDEDPVVIEINAEENERILEMLKNTKIRYKKKEIGMEVGAPLYTITLLAGNGDVLTVTVNEENKLHFNGNEVTYSTTGNGTPYQVLQDVFANH